MLSKGWLVLAAEKNSGVARQTTKDNVLCVDDDPFALNVSGLG